MSLTHRGSCVASGRARRPAQTKRKAVLTCPHCQHESSLDGDWKRTSHDRETEIRCPDCEKLLTVRRQFGSEASK